MTRSQHHFADSKITQVVSALNFSLSCIKVTVHISKYAIGHLISLNLMRFQDTRNDQVLLELQYASQG